MIIKVILWVQELSGFLWPSIWPPRGSIFLGSNIGSPNSARPACLGSPRHKELCKSSLSHTRTLTVSCQCRLNEFRKSKEIAYNVLNREHWRDNRHVVNRLKNKMHTECTGNTRFITYWRNEHLNSRHLTHSSTHTLCTHLQESYRTTLESFKFRPIYWFCVGDYTSFSNPPERKNRTSSPCKLAYVIGVKTYTSLHGDVVRCFRSGGFEKLQCPI